MSTEVRPDRQAAYRRLLCFAFADIASRCRQSPDDVGCIAAIGDWLHMLPSTIGVMLIALLVSLALIIAGHFASWIREGAERLFKQVEFGNTLMQGMLCFLLFAGALHIDLNDLADHRGVIATLAVVGVVISMFVFGTLIYRSAGWDLN